MPRVMLFDDPARRTQLAKDFWEARKEPSGKILSRMMWKHMRRAAKEFDAVLATLEKGN